MTGNLIPLSEAVKMTSIFRTDSNSVLDPAYQDMGILPTCESFDKSCFVKLFTDINCVGVRVYLAMDERLRVKLVIVGVNAQNEDVYIKLNPNEPLEESYVIENGVRCPDSCPPASPLNP